ncbi:MAG TPA: hypothetical protein DCS30_00545 [Rhizobiales bacterium]|nr:hypothetical protein [Hyphomicrobiales bacterium]
MKKEVLHYIFNLAKGVKEKSKKEDEYLGKWVGESENLPNFKRENGPNKFRLEFDLTKKQKGICGDSFQYSGKGRLIFEDVAPNTELELIIHLTAMSDVGNYFVYEASISNVKHYGSGLSHRSNHDRPDFYEGNSLGSIKGINKTPLVMSKLELERVECYI